MTHPIFFPRETKARLSQLLNARLRQVDFSRYGNEPNFTPALIQELHGVVYEDDICTVIFEGAVMTSVSKYSAEWWAGADCSVVATISEGGIRTIKKATLIQSKIGKIEQLPSARKEQLIEQIRDMRALTNHPKVLEISKSPNEVPTVVSAVGILTRRRLQHQTFGDWVATRVLPTFDGDTRPPFVAAVLDAQLSKLKIYARKKGQTEGA
jgi:hypothetical protein